MSNEAIAQSGRGLSERYGARHPLLAPWPRQIAYLVWRALFGLARPVAFLGLLGVSVWLAQGVARDVVRAPLALSSLEDRIEAGFEESLPAGVDRRTVWINGLERALQTRPGSLPDLSLANSFALAAFDIEGRDTLARQYLAQGRRAVLVEADLRGRSARDQRIVLEQALESIREEGRAAGLAPPELVLAPQRLRQRLERLQSLFGPTLAGAADWFADPAGRAMTLSALPGMGDSQTILYGDVRDAIVQGCALAEQVGRRIAQCRVGFLPKPRGDVVLAGLSLASFAASESEQTGARLAKAAWASGRLDPDFAEALVLGPDPVLGREALLASLLSVLGEAGDAWSQPSQYEGALAEAAAEYTRAARIAPGVRQRTFAAIYAIQEQAGTFSTLATLQAVSNVDEVERLALLSEVAGPRLNALGAISPDALDSLLQAQNPQRRFLPLQAWTEETWLRSGLAALGFFLAALLVILTVLKGHSRARGGPPGGMERLDRAMTRLILGNNF